MPELETAPRHKPSPAEIRDAAADCKGKPPVRERVAHSGDRSGAERRADHGDIGRRLRHPGQPRHDSRPGKLGHASRPPGIHPAHPRQGTPDGLNEHPDRVEKRTKHGVGVEWRCGERGYEQTGSRQAAAVESPQEKHESRGASFALNRSQCCNVFVLTGSEPAPTGDGFDRRPIRPARDLQ